MTAMPVGESSAAGIKVAKVGQMKRVADDILSVELLPADGSRWSPCEAGAHIDVRLPGGIVRSYSLINPRHGGSYLIAVYREPDSRGGSRYIHEELNIGDTVWVSAPRNNFPLVHGPRPVVLIAGGIGVTPLLAMARELSDRKSDWVLYYSVRTRNRIGFTEILDEFRNNVVIHVDDEVGGPPDIGAMIHTFDDCDLYCCGPKPMMDAFEAGTGHLPPERVHREYFSGVNTNMDGAAFQVELVRSGVRLRVPADKTVLQVLEEEGIPVESSCRAGICGACEVGVMDGEPDHRDSVLTDVEKREGKSMMICCSRSLTPLLRLDL